MPATMTMPGLANTPFGPFGATFYSDTELDPLLESFVQRFKQIEQADQEKSSLLKVRLFEHDYNRHRLTPTGGHQSICLPVPSAAEPRYSLVRAQARIPRGRRETLQCRRKTSLSLAF
jgi:hypothetical protein